MTGRIDNGRPITGGTVDVGGARVLFADEFLSESPSRKGDSTAAKVVATRPKIPNDANTAIMILRRDHRCDVAGIRAPDRAYKRPRLAQAITEQAHPPP